MQNVALPIDPLLPSIVAGLTNDLALVLEAPPGSGKTTRVPPACLQAECFRGKEILILEPRRLAAKMAAYRVAEELGEDVGETVGYQFRFENVGGRNTRIRFLTEGMFLRRLLSEPTLPNVGLVIIDEFHERHLQGDLALGLVRRLQTTSRPDLRTLVMSATLDGEAVAKYFDCKVVRAEGRRFPVDIEYAGDTAANEMDTRIATIVAKLVSEGHQGDILAFLPGVGEIRRTQDAIQRKTGSDLLVLPLYADLSKQEQEIAVRPATKQKVVLATNVAETSVTIPGITAVIDSGLARIPSHNWWSGLPVLRMSKISQASATQRAGRAGRTAPGRCIRLYASADFSGRPSYQTPEVQRLDMAQSLLELKAMGIGDPKMFPWYEAPPESSLKAAEGLLYRLGATEEAGNLTALGRQMAAIPAHPRMGRLVLEAAKRGIPYEGATLAAWQGERAAEDLDNEVAGLLHAVLQSERGKGYRPPGSQLADRARQQLLRAVAKDAKPSNLPPEKRDEEARKSVLAAFPDRVGRIRAVGKTLSRNRSGESVEVVLCGGGSARLLNPHLPAGIEFVVALDAEERSQGGLKGDVRLRLVGAVEPDWLLDVEPVGVQEGIEAVWNERLEKVEVRSRLMYEKLVISDAAPSAKLGPAEQKAAEELLRQKCMAAGLEAFVDKDLLAEWTQRLAFAREHLPKLEFPEFGPAFLEKFFESLCEGRIRFQEIRDAQPFEYLKLALTQEQRNALDKMAPSTLPLPGGRRLTIHYETGKPPWVASRMQDFFGMRETPKLAGGGVPVVLHLLAPNQRAVQVTADLSGFWQREYPSLRKELGRRYPRHYWPEDPFTAEPPPPRPPRPPRK